MYHHHVLRIRVLTSDFETFKDGPKRRRLSEFCNQSKLADVLVASKLVRRYGEQGFVTDQRSRNLKTGLMRHAEEDSSGGVDPSKYADTI